VPAPLVSAEEVLTRRNLSDSLCLPLDVESAKTNRAAPGLSRVSSDLCPCRSAVQSLRPVSGGFLRHVELHPQRSMGRQVVIRMTQPCTRSINQAFTTVRYSL